jgi:acyl-CoA thioesterase-1
MLSELDVERSALDVFRMNRAVATIIAILSTVVAQTASAAESKTILVFGDSLSDGFMLKRSEAYPALLSKKLRAAGLNYAVTNASASGGTTDGGLERLPPHLKHRIDILILELGINDVFQGLQIDQIQNNLQRIIDKVRARNPNARVVIAGIQIPGYAADDYVSAFGQMFADLAAKNRAALVPYLLEGVAGNPSLNLPDGIHPNAAGQKILAENVWRVLEPVAREVAKL